jgi:hypothetical protein
MTGTENMKTPLSTGLDEGAIQALRTSLRGALLRPGDDSYEATRRVWNGMIDRKPALIVRCAGVAAVITAVNFARTDHLLVSVRGGGHSVAGNAVCDGGLMIDLSGMKGIWVDETIPNRGQIERLLKSNLFLVRLCKIIFTSLSSRFVPTFPQVAQRDALFNEVPPDHGSLHSSHLWESSTFPSLPPDQRCEQPPLVRLILARR